MTETTTCIESNPFGRLSKLVIACLAPMFLGVTGGDIGLARGAAIETVNAYRARNHADLIAVAQIVGFGLAALGSLSLSMADEITVTLALRLRGNANACNRSAEQNRRALGKSQANDLPCGPELAGIPFDLPADDLPAEAEVIVSPAVESHVRLPQPSVTLASSTTTENEYQQTLAIAMAQESCEIIVNLPNLPPEERNEAAIRAALLSSTAHDLLNSEAVPPPRPDIIAAAVRRDATSEQAPR